MPHRLTTYEAASVSKHILHTHKTLVLKDTDLWCQIVWCSTESCCLAVTKDVLLTHSKVCQLNVAVLVQQYVVWLQISE